MRGGWAARPQGDLLCHFASRQGVHRRASPCGRSRAAPKAGELDEASSDSFNIGSLGDITHAKDLVAEIIAARTRKRLTEELSMRTMRRRRMRISALVVLAILPSLSASAQQKPPPAPRPGERAEKPGEPPEEALPRAEKEREQPGASSEGDELLKLKWDMAERAPIATHHQVNAGGRSIKYTATAGRMPIKDQAGTTEAQVFFVAYTQDGADLAKRPLTFAFNGGPGSASIWLHMGALGPRKVALQKEGFMPEAPYRLMDNTQTPLDKTDLVLIDAIGTGFSRPADMKKAKKFWGLKGDAQAFGEFIRLFLSRHQRWSSPLYLLGESYGSTRAAEVAGYLSDRGISFKGIILL